MLICYRLYTERKPFTDKIVKRFFDNFTLVETSGCYKGGEESGLMIEIIDSHHDQPRVYSLARAIKEENNQESVLVTESDIRETHLI